MESFNTLFEAQLLVDDWRLEYNHYRPHQSRDYTTPAAHARRRTIDIQSEPS
jgi:putative transposase